NYKDTYEDGEQQTEYVDLREQIDAMFDPKDTTRRVRGSLTRDDIVLYNNKDTAESSIYKLLELYEKYQYSLFGKSSSDTEIKKGLEALTKDTYSVDSLPLNSLIAVNASAQLKEKLMQYLSTIRYAQKQGQFKDIARI